MDARCEFCDRAAQWQFTEVVGGRRATVHVCSDCAQQRGIVGMSAVSPVADEPPAPQMITTIKFGITQKIPASQLPTAPRRCATCGTTLVAIRKTGRVGCADCYQTFRVHLQPLLKRVHGELVHRGHRPDLSSPAVDEVRREELDRLRAELRRAVEDEDFENAARLRDAIAQWHTASRKEPS